MKINENIPMEAAEDAQNVMNITIQQNFEPSDNAMRCKEDAERESQSRSKSYG